MNKMPDFIINDRWIMDRISSQSSSFSKWISGLIHSVENALGDINVSEKDRKDLGNFEKEMAKARNELSAAKKELAALDFGPIGSNLGGKAIKWVSNLIDKEIQKKVPNLDKIGLDNDLNLEFLTGKRKTLSFALLDVSKEKGIQNEGLLYLIKSLPDLEAFLYSTSVQKYYRDHTEHTLRVAVLGDFLLEQDAGQGKLISILSDMLDIDKVELKEKVWWITSLLHDIGYPLGKISTSVNFSLLNQLLKCYPSLDLEFVPFEIGLSWKSDQKEYLKIIEEGLSKEAKMLIRRGSGIEGPQLPSFNSKTFLQQKKGHPEFTFAPKIELDHGVLSALSLLKGLGKPEEIRSNDEYNAYVLAAKSIALHNFKIKLPEHNFDNQPLTFFLMLIDELQEWGRPIPIQVQGTYFTTEFQKISLLDEIYFQLDEFTWSMQFRNEKAKKLMNFDFNKFSKVKKDTFGRLTRGTNFSKTLINLQDLKSLDESKTGDQILSEVKIEI